MALVAVVGDANVADQALQSQNMLPSNSCAVAHLCTVGIGEAQQYGQSNLTNSHLLLMRNCADALGCRWHWWGAAIWAAVKPHQLKAAMMPVVLMRWCSGGAGGTAQCGQEQPAERLERH